MTERGQSLPTRPGAEAGARLGDRRIRLREITCRSVLSPSGIPGFDYSINPYVGCAHACAYCYAHYMQRYSGHDEPWGSFVDVKLNAAHVLLRQLRRTPPSSVFMSSVTDPYQPAEERYRITRHILEIMAPLPHALGIHTKSPLVERDRAVLRRFKDLSVTFTIVTGDERAARCLEPGAPTVGARIRALDNLARCGIATAVFIGPTIPFVTDRGIEELIGRLARAGVREVILDDLHYLPRIRARLLPALKAYDTGIASRSMQIPENYYQQTGQFILECCRNQGIQCSKLF